LGISESSLVVGTVGRLSAVKNHKLLVECISTLLEKAPQLMLVIVGDGPLRSMLQELAAQLGVQSNLLLAGETDNVAKLLPAFDVFVMPSLSEGHSIALLEAAVTGLPIVASATGGNPEIISHEETGLLVPVGDMDATAAAIWRVLSQPEFAQQLGGSARAWAARAATIESMASGYGNLYQEVMRGS
jgi:glycosyltransferase involved in cell wall biosynthesis